MAASSPTLQKLLSNSFLSKITAVVVLYMYFELLRLSSSENNQKN